MTYFDTWATSNDRYCYMACTAKFWTNPEYTPEWLLARIALYSRYFKNTKTLIVLHNTATLLLFLLVFKTDVINGM